MRRRTFLAYVGTGAAYTMSSICNVLAQTASNSSGTLRPLRIRLSTPGRIAFYVDYSELNNVGTHTFYVYRTHGTVGQVSVRYMTSGDAHDHVSGILMWQDGEADMKFFTVMVSKKDPGEHRIIASLSDPTGGAKLHYGPIHTVAYGVIDDDTISADAVFFDANAGHNGIGTLGDPFDNIYDAIANVGNARFIYGQGLVTVDGTNKGGSGKQLEAIDVPATRTSEGDRLFIRNWPGKSLAIRGDGVSTNQCGFWANGGESWLTFRGIKFRDFDATGTFGENGAIVYLYGKSTGINVELCSFDNINSSTNIAGFMPWGVQGSKVWRCTANNIQVNGLTSHNNSGGVVITYDGQFISVQRCTVSNAAHGAYQKRIVTTGDISMNIKFCHFIGCDVHFGASGKSGASHSYTIVQGNIFESAMNGGIWHRTINPSNVGQKAGWWCNNVFDKCGHGEIAAIHLEMANGAHIFNNIMIDCRKVWADTTDRSPFSDIEYADYNHEFGTTLPAQKYEWRGMNYETANQLHTAAGHEGNGSTGDPLFRNRASVDYVLHPNSPAAGTGISGTNRGIYLIGNELVGAHPAAPVKKPATMHIEVVDP